MRFGQALEYVYVSEPVLGISSITSPGRITDVSWADRHGHGILYLIPSERRAQKRNRVSLLLSISLLEALAKHEPRQMLSRDSIQVRHVFY